MWSVPLRINYEYWTYKHQQCFNGHTYLHAFFLFTTVYDAHNSVSYTLAADYIYSSILVYDSSIGCFLFSYSIGDVLIL